MRGILCTLLTGLCLAVFGALCAESALAAPKRDCRPLWHKDRAAFERCVHDRNWHPGQPGPQQKKMGPPPHRGDDRFQGPPPVRERKIAQCKRLWHHDRAGFERCVRGHQPPPRHHR